jgi:phospholipid/cholesterol/gamma-HCH transport system ATP-binding protein
LQLFVRTGNEIAAQFHITRLRRYFNWMDMNSETIISVKNLTARYEDNIILDDISFHVLKGEVFVILGTSGSGKSTLLRHMIGLIKPYAGSIIVDGVDITTGDEDAFGNLFKKIGVLFQGSALFGSMTLAENIALPLLEYTRFPKDVIAKLVHLKLCRFDLADYEEYTPAEISGGMKKRAGLARALALSPKILFLDEPTAGLDPITSAEIDDLILQIRRESGATVVAVTHQLDSIFNIADRIIMIDKGKKGIIAEGDPIFLRDHSVNPFVRQFFVRKRRKTED